MALLDSGKRNSRPKLAKPDKKKGLGEVTGPPLLDTLSRGVKRPAPGMGSVVIYPPSAHILQRSRERPSRGDAHRCSRRLALDGLARLCYSSGAAGLYILQSRPLPMNGKGRGIGLNYLL